jgi:hypothetical protein
VALAGLRFAPGTSRVRVERVAVAGQVVVGPGAHDITVARSRLQGISARAGSHDLVFDHNLIVGADNGIELVSTATGVPGAPGGVSNQPPIRRVRITGNRIVAPSTDALFLTNFRDVLVDGNEITGLVERGQHSDALQTVFGGSGLVFRRNYLHGNSSQGFFIKDGRVTNVTIADNLIVGNRSWGAPVSFYDVRPDRRGPRYTGSGARIVHNTVWGNAALVHIRGGDSRRLLIHDNVLQGLVADEASRAQLFAAGLDQRGNVIGRGLRTRRDVGGRPRFRWAARGDWRLARSSPGARGRRLAAGVTWSLAGRRFGP